MNVMVCGSCWLLTVDRSHDPRRHLQAYLRGSFFGRRQLRSSRAGLGARPQSRSEVLRALRASGHRLGAPHHRDGDRGYIAQRHARPPEVPLPKKKCDRPRNCHIPSLR